MTTKRILITGLGTDASEQGIRSLLGQFGPVKRVEIIRQGNPDEPVALVEMHIGDGMVAHLESRLAGYWHEGSLISACLLMH